MRPARTAAKPDVPGKGGHDLYLDLQYVMRLQNDLQAGPEPPIAEMAAEAPRLRARLPQRSRNPVRAAGPGLAASLRL